MLAILLVSNGGCKKTSEEAQQAATLRILAWVGYDEPEFIKPLEQQLGIRIEVKTYVGGDQMYSLFRAAPPGTYDVVIVDAEYGERMYREGLIRSLDRNLWHSPDLFSPFLAGDPVQVDGNVYGAVVRWGALGLVYNRDHINPDEAKSYKVLWAPSSKGKVGIFDWYLPNMGVISRYLGNARPYDLDEKALQQVKDALRRLRPQVRAIHPNTGDVINDLRSGEVWLCPGIGEWASAVLEEEGKPIDWTVPSEGGVMWVEALAIPTSSKNSGTAQRFIDTVRLPEHLARLSWRKAYHSQSPRREAYSQLSTKQRAILQAENLDEIQSLINRLAVRKLPGPQTTEKEWIQAWMLFKTEQ